MSKVNITFPWSPSNSYWDGKVHVIDPKFLAQINDSAYYMMQGYDETFKTNMLTVLKKTKDGFAKLPLASQQEYQTFYDHCMTTARYGGLHQQDVEALNKDIPSLPIMPVAQVIKESSGKSK